MVRVSDRRGYRLAKRGLDLIVALTALVLLSPVLIVLAILVRYKLGTPALFRQVRPGLQGKPFHILKFRTMSDDCDSDGHLLPDAARLREFGKLLRSTSLDELPELVNVIRGEMSLVGPRPLRMHYLERYSIEQARRHDVLPGITGWAQINGRNAISWEDKFALDLWYVDNRSMLVDLQILLRTATQVLKREGIAAEDHVTMPPFLGESEE